MLVTDYTRLALSRGHDGSRASLSNRDSCVIPNMRWGQCHEILSPAYWAHQASIADQQGLYQKLRLGDSLKEEIVACLLGGHGVSAEIGLAFFDHLKCSGLLSARVPKPEEIYGVLSGPVSISGRLIHYRFARRKSAFISEVLYRLEWEDPPLTHAHELRNWLLESPGIGPKTASWIVRNWLRSDEVAIIDIHIYRAGCYMGLFAQTDSIERNYYGMEQLFLEFASRLAVRTSLLDSLMWDHMRRYGNTILKMIEA